jgi:guanine nucleotide-binding protein G(I)/G(S)/G(T) subunit beta-1
VASGGLDNTVSIHRIRSAHHAPARGFRAPAQTLCAHDGYISCCRYVDRGGTRLLSASGDTSCVLWDTERGADLRRYGREHAGDVLSLAVCPTNESLFVSGSIDLTARLWDLRCAGDRSVMCFDGMHTSDVNSVAFLPGGAAFGTASEDSSCALFDLRSCAQLCRFECAAATSGATSLSFSASGRLAFAGYEDHTVRVWDTLGAAGAAAAAAAAGAAAGHGEQGELGERTALGSCEPIATLAGHGGQVSAVSVAPDGSAVMTASWDTTLRIWS